MPSRTVPDVERETHALSQAIQQETASLMAGIRNLVARSALAEGAAIQSLAEDVFQEVVLLALQHRHEYDERRPARPWLMKFAINYLRNLRSAQDRRRGIVTPVAETGQVRAALATSDVGNTQDVSEAEMFDLLGRARSSEMPGDLGWKMLISLAPEGDRPILTLRFYDGLEHEEIGRALGITPGTARTRLCRALERLRQAYWQSERDAEGIS